LERFIKTTAAELSGPQKAAILLAEIGPLLNNNYNELYKHLKLSTLEIEKLRIAMENLTPYLKTEPKNIDEIYREQAVLAEAINFGRQRGIFHPIPKEQLKNTHVKTTQAGTIASMVNENPEGVAKLVSQWLDE
jgi:hypothetical protein